MSGIQRNKNYKPLTSGKRCESDETTAFSVNSDCFKTPWGAVAGGWRGGIIFREVNCFIRFHGRSKSLKFGAGEFLLLGKFYKVRIF